MKTPKQPSAPNPNTTIKSQARSNIQTGIANSWMQNANEVGPMGNVTYTQSGTKRVGGLNVPQFTRTTSLSKEQQGLYDQQVGLGSQMNTMAGQQLDNLQGGLSGGRGYYEDALMSRLNPQLDRDRAALESRLANQGIMPGSEAYREAIALSDRGMNDARSQAVLQAGDYAGQEINQALSQLSAYTNGGQPTIPQSSAYRGGSVAPTDVAGIMQADYNNQMAAYNQKMQSRNAMMGGIAGLAGTLLAPMTGGLSLAASGAMMGGIGR